MFRKLYFIRYEYYGGEDGVGSLIQEKPLFMHPVDWLKNVIVPELEKGIRKISITNFYRVE